MRSLYQCSQARCHYLPDLDFCGLYCKAYHPLIGDHPLNYYRMKHSDSLRCDTCEDCVDFSDNGEMVAKKDRGWD